MKEVQCFRCRGIGYYKWEYPNIEVKKKRKWQEEIVCLIKGKAQQQEKVRGIELVHPNWEKT